MNGLKVLLTGASGFIGSSLAPRLVTKGYDLYCLTRYVTGRIGEASEVKTVYADLTDYFSLVNAVKSIHPDVVIHLASISPVSYSYDHPLEVNDVNYMGTINLCEALRRQCPSLKQFLFAGTSEEYGNNGQDIQVEENPLCPASPYAISKVASELYLRYMRKAYEFPVTILRPFNTYGRREDTHFLIEKTIVQMLRGGNVRLRDPTPVRDWLYVEDHVNAYLTCLEREDYLGETFNFCSGIGLSIKDTVEMIGKVTEFSGEVRWFSSEPERPYESRVIVGSYAKAEKALGWTPKWSLKQGLEATVKHWRTRLES